MSRVGLAIAAEALTGVPFRLHGRDPARGLDCVGVVTASLAAIGRCTAIPLDYGLRNKDVGPWLVHASSCGLEATSAPDEPGNVLLVRTGPAQFHLLVAARDGQFVHAHAALGRVTRSPGPLAWPIVRRWRLSE